MSFAKKRRRTSRLAWGDAVAVAAAGTDDKGGPADSSTQPKGKGKVALRHNMPILSGPTFVKRSVFGERGQTQLPFTGAASNRRNRVHGSARHPPACTSKTVRGGDNADGKGNDGNGKLQMLLDFGQHGVGTTAQAKCKDCGMVYVPCVAEDAARHATFCAMTQLGVPFPGWKQQREVARFADASPRAGSPQQQTQRSKSHGCNLSHASRNLNTKSTAASSSSCPVSSPVSASYIVHMAPGAPRAHQLKALEVKRFMDDEFGFTDEDEWLSRHIYFFVTDARIVGCVCATRIETALRVVYRDHGRGGATVGETSGPSFSNGSYTSNAVVQERPKQQQPKHNQLGDGGGALAKTERTALACETIEGTTSTGAVASIWKDKAAVGVKTELNDVAPTVSPSVTIAAAKMSAAEATKTTQMPGSADATEIHAEQLDEASKSAARARGLVEISGLWCNPNPVRAVAGVCHIWVHKRHRRRNIATRLVDAMRASIVYGYRVKRQECAFSAPTEAGARFASAYVRGSENTSVGPGTDTVQTSVLERMRCDTNNDCTIPCATDLLVF